MSYGRAALHQILPCRRGASLVHLALPRRVSPVHLYRGGPGIYMDEDSPGIFMNENRNVEVWGGTNLMPRIVMWPEDHLYAALLTRRLPCTLVNLRA